MDISFLALELNAFLALRMQLASLSSYSFMTACTLEKYWSNQRQATKNVPHRVSHGRGGSGTVGYFSLKKRLRFWLIRNSASGCNIALRAAEYFLAILVAKRWMACEIQHTCINFLNSFWRSLPTHPLQTIRVTANQSHHALDYFEPEYLKYFCFCCLLSLRNHLLVICQAYKNILNENFSFRQLHN